MERQEGETLNTGRHRFGEAEGRDVEHRETPMWRDRRERR